MYRLCFILTILLLTFSANAQTKLPPKQMTYLSTSKPNSIFYNDTFYSGSKEFKQLFFRTKDAQLIELYKKHQVEKIFGSAMGTAGSLALAVGVIYAGGNHNRISRGAGWAIAGSGLVTSIVGSYISTEATSDLILATYLFNKRYANPKTAIGISSNGLSFVVKL